MKRWTETRDVLERLAELRQRGIRAALATVVRVVGSAYRREGAKLLVAEDATTCGNVSGGCLEEDVREVALRVLATGTPELRSYCSGADDVNAWDLGIGCDGQVDVFVTPALVDPIPMLALLEGDQPFAVATFADAADPVERQLIVVPGRTLGSLGDAALNRAVEERARDRLDEGNPAIHTVFGREIFIEPFRPPPRLVIHGAGEDARPLAILGSMAGFRVIVADRRGALLSPDRFPPRTRLVAANAEDLSERLPLDETSYAVAMSHSYADDLAFLRCAARTTAAYIGVLGPKLRTERMLSALDLEGLRDDGRIHGPVGLDLGAEGAEQVAISIISEILAVHAGRNAGSLRDRSLPIHAAAAD
jgi:xanthine dehydrogenase accessory factor